MLKPEQQTGRAEFIVLAALLMSVVAMSVDVMLPGLGALAADLDIQSGNQRQWVITMMFIGFTIGQLIFGPVSDAVGRRKTTTIGIFVFIAGTLICTLAQSYSIFLIGRFFQGIGAAGPRIGTIAMVRDRFAGVEMAKVMSVVMGIFILVPIVAPLIGQALLLVMPWRGLFAALALVFFCAGAWVLLRQPETLKTPAPFQTSRVVNALVEIGKDGQALYITVASGCAFGALLGFINSSQQVLQDLYQVGNTFALWFGFCAIFVSVATFTNVFLVKHFSMFSICRNAMWLASAVAVLFLIYLRFQPTPALIVWIGFNCSILFLLGLTFGNYSALTLERLGHVAGLAAAITGALNTAVALIIAAAIGLSFNSTVVPVTWGYAIFTAMTALLIMVAISSLIN